MLRWCQLCAQGQVHLPNFGNMGIENFIFVKSASCHGRRQFFHLCTEEAFHGWLCPQSTILEGSELLFAKSETPSELFADVLGGRCLGGPQNPQLSIVPPSGLKVCCCGCEHLASVKFSVLVGEVAS